MHGERSGVVIGMPALEGVRHHKIDTPLPKQHRKSARNVGHVQRGLLVGQTQTNESLRRHASQADRGTQFGAARGGIIVRVREAVRLRGAFVARRSVGQVDKRDAAQTG